ncbi:MAG TPA: hypothetical protein VHO25_16765 [Polyangiaceae bacterium]|nr:hypothetical protein [Polyangiaceae bacterium]
MRSSLAGLLPTVLLLACGTGGTPDPVAPPSRPRPAAVAIDPATHIPERNATGHWGALEQPAPRALVIEVLDELFAAITREDLSALSALFTSDAEVIVARGSKARALEFWSRRLERLDYTSQFSSLIYSPARVVISEAKRSDAAAPKVQALLLRPGEWLARVPISPALGNSKLFGKLIEVVISETAGQCKIRVLREDFELPDAPR